MKGGVIVFFILGIFLVLAFIMAKTPSVAAVTLVALFIFGLLIRRAVYGLAVIVILMIGLFGIYNPANPLLAVTGSFGTLALVDIISISLLAYFAYLFITKQLKSTPLNRPVIVLLLMFVIQAFRAFFLQGQSFLQVGRIMRPLFSYLMFFIILARIRNRKELNLFLKLLLVISLISSAIVIHQCIFGWSPMGALRRMGDIYRHNNVATEIITSIFLLSFCILPFLKLKKRSFVLFLVLPAYFAVFLYSGSRALWGTLAISIAACLLLMKRTDKNMQIFASIALFLIISVAFFGPTAVENFLNPFRTRAETTIPTLIEREGTFLTRINLYKAKWDIVKKDNILMGIGFRYGSLRRDTIYGATGADNGIAHIVFRFGLIGYLLFGWIFISFFKRAFFMLKHIKPSTDRAILVGLVATNIQLLLQLFFSDTLFRHHGIIVYVLSWALLEIIWEFHYKERQDEEFARSKQSIPQI